MRIALTALLAGLVLHTRSVPIAVGQQTPSADTGWTLVQPITGRAIPCEHDKIKLLDCKNVELLSYLPSSALGGGPEVFPGVGGAGAFDIWGWTDAATKREFAIVGGSDATAFVEVTDPVNPKYLGRLPFHYGVKGISGVKVYKNHAFIVVEDVDSAGLQVFDLTQLRNVKAPPATFQETAHYDEFGNAHTLTMNVESGFAFAAGIKHGKQTCGMGLHMIDVRKPTKPAFAGCYVNMDEGGNGGAGYIHDAMCVTSRGPDQRYRRRELCLAAAGSAVLIVDVTNKKAPKMIGAARYPKLGFAHQGWLTEDQRYFFVDDEFDEMFKLTPNTRTIVFDLNKLDDPVLLTEYLSTTTSTDHNLYINGRYMYQSNYNAGLRVIDVADPAHPVEVGYLDTDPKSNATGMDLGSWGNYPFFKNGVVAVASNGLFLVRLRSQP